ncbi:MAG TPA: tripartite tricarboxylate transporter substrate binding protein [Xanthobacteraceae bacterium]|nr:tripartite tricarboxylate transporter substrate binding protein [Xanthobacteraceae bacterium]
MKFQRRKFLRLATIAIAMPAISRIAIAETYPARAVRIVVPFPPGGVGDIIARLIGQSLQDRLGQSVIIENRPGAGGNVGTEAVIKSPADGYQLIWIGTNNAINATLYEKLNFNFIRDVAPVAGVVRGPLVMAINPSVPAKTVPEFIAYAKANPGKINMVSSGNGTGPHLAGEMFKMMTGVQMVHVPYRGEAPALTDLVGGQAQVMFANLPSSIEHIRGGRLRALAVTTATRSPALPDVPVVADFVKGYEASTWLGVGAPKATPSEVIAKLNREINLCLKEPKLVARLAELGTAPMPLSPQAFAAFIAADTDKWAKAVKFSGAKVD